MSVDTKQLQKDVTVELSETDKVVAYPDRSGVILQLETENLAEEIPEGCYPEDFGPGPHFVYPNVWLSLEHSRQVRDALDKAIAFVESQQAQHQAQG